MCTREAILEATLEVHPRHSHRTAMSDDSQMCRVWACGRIAMAGWLHGVCVGECFFVFPLCGFSLALFCNYSQNPCLISSRM